MKPNQLPEIGTYFIERIFQLKIVKVFHVKLEIVKYKWGSKLKRIFFHSIAKPYPFKRFARLYCLLGCLFCTLNMDFQIKSHVNSSQTDFHNLTLKLWEKMGSFGIDVLLDS